jgi:hypothetical protein
MDINKKDIEGPRELLPAIFLLLQYTHECRMNSKRVVQNSFCKTCFGEIVKIKKV